jgi:regulation of enolase protein 1 (concanavalin A-like superfamily)
MHMICMARLRLRIEASQWHARSSTQDASEMRPIVIMHTNDWSTQPAQSPTMKISLDVRSASRRIEIQSRTHSHAPRISRTALEAQIGSKISASKVEFIGALCCAARLSSFVIVCKGKANLLISGESRKAPQLKSRSIC